MSGRTEREDRIREILGVCSKKQWTYDTPNMAGKLERILAPAGFRMETTRDYVYAIMDLLAVEKESRKQGSLKLASRPSFSANFATSTSKPKSHSAGSKNVSATIPQVTPYKKSRKKDSQTRNPLTSQPLNPRKTGLVQSPTTSRINKVPHLT